MGRNAARWLRADLIKVSARGTRSRSGLSWAFTLESSSRTRNPSGVGSSTPRSAGRECDDPVFVLVTDVASCSIRYLFDADGWHIAHPPDLAKLRRIDPRLAYIAERSQARARLAAAEVNDASYSYSAYTGECECEHDLQLRRHSRLLACVQSELMVTRSVDAFHTGVSCRAD